LRWQKITAPASRYAKPVREGDLGREPAPSAAGARLRDCDTAGTGPAIDAHDQCGTNSERLRAGRRPHSGGVGMRILSARTGACGVVHADPLAIAIEQGCGGAVIDIACAQSGCLEAGEGHD
jgi:hypothetical protein